MAGVGKSVAELESSLSVPVEKPLPDWAKRKPRGALLLRPRRRAAGCRLVDLRGSVLSLALCFLWGWGWGRRVFCYKLCGGCRHCACGAVDGVPLGGVSVALL